MRDVHPIQTFTVPNLLQRLRESFRPQPPTIYCYGDERLGLSPEEMQPVIDGLFLSLWHAGYGGEAHLCWYDAGNPLLGIEAGALEGLKREEPVFGYRLGSRMCEAPQGFYWRMMAEHPSMRVYQLEIQD